MRGERVSSQPASVIYQPPLMDTVKDTLPELLPIFTFLNSHANKLYQEGYFLKLNDLDISKPSWQMTDPSTCNADSKQAVIQTSIVTGQSVLPSSSAPCCPCGTLPL